MPEEKLRPTYNFTEDRLADLKAVLPEAFADGTLNWDVLRDLLTGHLDDEGPDAEHFGLSWPGKREARRLAAKPSGNTLRPAPGQGVNEDTTHNLYLEGDNLEILKLLQKSYARKVKMIYIDPPYNTGNDLIYKDDFSEPSVDYLRRSGQAGESGELLTSNLKSSGRFHSAWLSMIYSRLRLARTLLRDDGVIFISIDDNEAHNLREVMDEVFGEESRVATIANVSNPKGRSDDKYVASAHEYILIYKASENSFLNGWEPEDHILKRYNKVDKNGLRYREIDLRKTGDNDRREDRPNLFYYFHYDPKNDHLYASREDNCPDGLICIKPSRADGKDGNWRWELDTASRNIADLIPRIMPTRGTWSVFEKDTLTEDKKVKPTSAWTQKEVNSERGSEQFIALGFDKEIFPRSKPVGMLKMALRLATNKSKDDIILDFFSGSASIAQSILELNQEDSGNRQFILAQLPEATPRDSIARKAGYETIAEIGKERIRRVIKQMKAKDGLGLLETPEELGFKVLTLAPSNFHAWKDYKGEDLEDLQQQFALFDDSPLVDGWTPAGLLTEVLLLEGFPLDSMIAPQAQFTQNSISLITCPAVGHRLWACFDATLYLDTLMALSLTAEDVFVCLDSALDDNAKLRLSQFCTLKTI